MQVDTAAVLLIVGAGREEHTEDANHDDLRDGLIIRHVPLVEVFDWMFRPQIEPWRLVVTTIQEHVHVLFEVQVVFVFPDVFALVKGPSLGVFDRCACLAPKQQTHVDIEDDEHLANGHDGKLERNAHCFHAYFLNLAKLAVNEVPGHTRIIVVVH